MESRLLGIPLVIWFLLVGLVALVDVPAYMWHNASSDQLGRLEYEVRVSKSTASVTVTPTASPSATVTPTGMIYKKVYLSPAVTTAPVK